MRGLAHVVGRTYRPFGARIIETPYRGTEDHMPSRGSFLFGNSSVRRGGRLRIAGWLAAGSMVLVGILAPAGALAAGPGNNGLDATGNGTKSNATVSGSLADAGGSAKLNADGVMTCEDTAVGSISGTLEITSTLDVGSKITLYLVPNNGSDASPAGNVSKNESTITLTGANNTSGSVIQYTINATEPFTTSVGGVLVVFAVNNDGTTAISSSKSNSLNCTEAVPTPTPTTNPTPTPTTNPTPTPTTNPTPTPTENPTPTPTMPPEFGSLMVTKEIPGVPEGFTGSFDIHVTCTGDFQADRTIDFPAPGSVTIDDIPAGAQCLVIETDRSDPPAGFEWAGSIITGPVDIAADETAALTVTNLLSDLQATASLGVVKSNNAPIIGGVPTASEGASVTYTLDWTATGTINNGVLTDVLPAGVTYTPGSATNGGAFHFVSFNAATRTLRWEAATATDTTGSVTYRVTINKGAAALVEPVRNTATIDSDETTPVSDTSDVFVPAPPLAETAPPTDVAGTTDGSVSGGSMLFILAALAGLVLVMAFVAPTPASIRKRR